MCACAQGPNTCSILEFLKSSESRSDLNSRPGLWDAAHFVSFSSHCRFITKRGIKVCADPHANWVKKTVRTMDKSRRMNMNQTKPPGA